MIHGMKIEWMLGVALLENFISVHKKSAKNVILKPQTAGYRKDPVSAEALAEF